MQNYGFIKFYVAQNKTFQTSLMFDLHTREASILKRSKRIIEKFEHTPTDTSGKNIPEANRGRT